MNTFGRHFRMTSFGESHGLAMGVVVDGCPAGVRWNESLLLSNLDRRRPGHSIVVSARNENDQPEVLSGVFEGQTLGTPIAVLIRNQDARSEDYNNLQPRTGHADDVWKSKFGHSDLRGGGRSSGRETVSRVIAGSIAQMALQQLAPELKVQGWIEQLGPLTLTREKQRSPEVMSLLEKAKAEGESFGGTVCLEVQNPIPNLGQPVFAKLKSDLTQALMSVGAVSGVQLGDGDVLEPGTGFHKGETSVYGGIRGGISTGETIVLKAQIKPTSSILDVAKKGRHDPAIVLRAQVVLEAMVNLVLVDHVLWRRLDCVSN